jgi:hypothetical protein
MACKSVTPNTALARAHLDALAEQIKTLPPAERAAAQKSLAVVAQAVTDLDAAYQRAEASAQANQAAANKYRIIRAIAIIAALVAGVVALKRAFF